ncbi:MAG TPA: hypothetical protein DCR10_11665 [Acidimicrobiaceae bacterium]|nr:hypothetical protein [Acidimicrobiaceae bacterium]
MASGNFSGDIEPKEVVERIQALEERLAAASGGRTKLLPVTKAFGSDAVRAVLATGRRAVGENYAQEILAKDAELASRDGLETSTGTQATRPAVDWHMIGRIQRNKVRQLGGLVLLWQTVDRQSVVDELIRRVPGARILVQVDPAGSPDKGGCPPGEVDDLVRRASDGGLTVDGLMTLGVLGNPKATANCFSVVARLADDLGLRERSMGMTDDMDLAVEHGSTMVRTGRAVFGDRPPRARP